MARVVTAESQVGFINLADAWIHLLVKVFFFFFFLKIYIKQTLGSLHGASWISSRALLRFPSAVIAEALVAKLGGRTAVLTHSALSDSRECYLF